MFGGLHFFGDSQPAISIQTMGKFPEDPKLEERRAAVRQRMKDEFKRPDLLSGGEWNSKHNTVLNLPVMVTAK